jgi:hypothetical protein
VIEAWGGLCYSNHLVQNLAIDIASGRLDIHSAMASLLAYNFIGFELFYIILCIFGILQLYGMVANFCSQFSQS